MASIRCDISYNASSAQIKFDIYIGYETPLQSGYDGQRRVGVAVGTTDTYYTISSSETRKYISHTTIADPGRSIFYHISTQYKNKSGNESDRFYTDQYISGYYTVPSSSGTTPGGSVNPGGNTGGGGTGGGGTGGGGTIIPTRPRIDEFDWYYDYASIAAYNAITSKGPTTDFSYVVWNRICEKVLQLKQSWGVSWDSRYLNYGNTCMSAYSKILTALRFNSLRYNIWASYAPVQTGDTVVGSWIIDMVNSLNNGIRSYNG